MESPSPGTHRGHTPLQWCPGVWDTVLAWPLTPLESPAHPDTAMGDPCQPCPSFSSSHKRSQGVQPNLLMCKPLHQQEQPHSWPCLSLIRLPWAVLSSGTSVLPHLLLLCLPLCVVSLPLSHSESSQRFFGAQAAQRSLPAPLETPPRAAENTRASLP